MNASPAFRLAEDGFRVAILFSSAKGEALCGSEWPARTNLRRNDTIERWSCVNVLLNGAARGPRAPVLELNDDQWQEVPERGDDGTAFRNEHQDFELRGFEPDLAFCLHFSTARQKHEFRTRIPMGCYSLTQEIDDMLIFLAWDAAGYISAQNLRVDGWIMQSV